jgi:hypothetical protein
MIAIAIRNPITAGVFGGIAVDQGVGPEVAADVGGEPETIKTDGHEFQRGATCHQAAEFATVTGKRQRQWRRRSRLRRHNGHLVHQSIPSERIFRTTA